MQKIDILSKPYVNIGEISCLLGISRKSASKLFKLLDTQEQEELKEYRIEKSKIRLSKVLENQRLNINTLIKQCEIEQKKSE